ncbi:MAG: hypothetical protein AAF267_24490 [Deinococcota bacterium]
MYHSSFSSSFAVRTMSLFMVLVLATCENNQASVSEPELVGPLLGMVEHSRKADQYARS